MVSAWVSVIHVPSAAGMGVEIGDVRDQVERARVRHEVHVIFARRRGVGHQGEGGTLKLWIVLSGLCYCTISSHIAPITTITFSSHNRPAQFVLLAIDSAKGRYATILGRDQLI